MSFQTDIAAGFADAQATLGGVTALWSAQTVPIIIGDNAMLLMLVEGGFLEGFSFGFTCSDAAAPSNAKAGQTLVVDGKTYRVLKISQNPGNPLLTVYCGSVNQ